MDQTFYREELLDHSDSSPHRGRLEAPDLRAELDNPLCGDVVALDLAVDPGGRIADVRFEGKGCVISQAAASLLAEQIEGRSLDEARGVSAEHMIEWIGIPLTPARRKCGLLALRALHRAIDSGAGRPVGAG